MMPRVPVLVILGATGSGKSRLGIELARRFSGEIISADSMQVYKGLDIVTAKVSKEERKMAPHHMLDFVDPLTHYNVVNFCGTVVPLVDDLLARKKLPIIVGGTNYYIESLLWKLILDEGSAWTPDDKKYLTVKNVENQAEVEMENGVSLPKKTKTDEVSQICPIPNEQLYERLEKVDPAMAKKIHPNNRRKIIRSLELIEKYGITHSELVKEQIESNQGPSGALRYPNSVVLWLQCEKAALGARLDNRVDGMLKDGLVQELVDFHRRYNEERVKCNSTPDYTKGIFQNIGLKEFHAYLTLSDEEKNTEKGQKLLTECVTNLKRVTRRYAKHQNRWVKNRFLLRANRQVPPVYSLDCTNVEQWDSHVFTPAEAIVSAIMQGEETQQRPLNENIEDRPYIDIMRDTSHYCEVCEKFIISDRQWQAHLNGSKHKRVVKRKEGLKAQEQTKNENSVSMITECV